MAEPPHDSERLCIIGLLASCHLEAHAPPSWPRIQEGSLPASIGPRTGSPAVNSSPSRGLSVIYEVPRGFSLSIVTEIAEGSPYVLLRSLALTRPSKWCLGASREPLSPRRPLPLFSSSLPPRTLPPGPLGGGQPLQEKGISVPGLSPLPF